MNVLEELKAAIARLHAAARAEGIEANSTLGVWLTSQEMAMMTLAEAMNWQVQRVEEFSGAVERAMKAEVERVRVAIQQCHAETALVRLKKNEAVDLLKVEKVELARELGAEISNTIKMAAMVREVRFNRRQNWSAVALVATVLLGCFVGGAVWNSYRADGSVISRCLKNQHPDENGKTYWCSMTDVLAGS